MSDLNKQRIDPYRSVARFFPLISRLIEWSLGGIRRDLLLLLKKRGLTRILDLGCGTGDLSRIFADRGFQPVGLDVSPAMLSRARKTAARIPPFPLVLGDGFHLPFKPLLDAAVMRFVFHEMEPLLREKAWKEMARVVRPGGLLILIDFTLPERPGLFARLGFSVIHFIEHRMDAIYPPHYIHYKELLEKGGTAAWIERHGAVTVESKRYFGGSIGLFAVSASQR
jgi:ubiquinone/menaquinone biosynthesis C-methylase UbiE